MRSPSRKRVTEIFLSLQTLVITLLLYSTYLEDRSNAYFRTWLSQNFPIGLIILDEWIVGGAITGLLLVTSYWIIQLEGEGKSRKVKIRPTQKAPFELKTETRPITPTPTYPRLKPIYDKIEMKFLFILLILIAQPVSLCFISPSILKSPILPA